MNVQNSVLRRSLNYKQKLCIFFDFSTTVENILLSFGRQRTCLQKGGMLSNGKRSKGPSLLESSSVRVWIRKVLLQTSSTPFFWSSLATCFWACNVEGEKMQFFERSSEKYARIQSFCSAEKVAPRLAKTCQTSNFGVMQLLVILIEFCPLNPFYASLTSWSERRP